VTLGLVTRTALALALVVAPRLAEPCSVGPWEPIRSRNGKFELRFDEKSHSWEVHDLEASRRAYRFPAKDVDVYPRALAHHAVVTPDGRHVVIIDTSPLTLAYGADAVVLRFFTEGKPGATYALRDLVVPGCSVQVDGCGARWILDGPVIEGGDLVLSTLQLITHRFRLEDGAHLQLEVPEGLRDVTVVSGTVKKLEPGWRSLKVRGVLRGDAALAGKVLRLAFDEESTGYPSMLADPNTVWAGATVVLRDGRIDPLTREFKGVMAAFFPGCDPSRP